MAANMMMDVLRKIQRDLGEQKDYIKNLDAIHRNINEKFNLMEGKLDQHQVIMEELKEQVKKNNTLLFGSNVLGIEYDDGTDGTTMSYTKLDDKNGVDVEKSDKDLESNDNEASQLQTPNEEPSLKQTSQVDDKKNNSFQNSNSGKNAWDSNTNDHEVKELFADFVKSAKRFYEETLPSVCQKEASIPHTYFMEQTGKLNEELKKIMSDMNDIKEMIRETAGNSNLAVLKEAAVSQYFMEQTGQLNEELKKMMSDMSEIKEMIMETTGNSNLAGLKEAAVSQYFMEQTGQLNEELKKMMSDMSDIKQLIRETPGKSNQADEDSIPTYAELIDQLNRQLKHVSEKHQSEIKETRELIKEMEAKSKMNVINNTPVRKLEKIQIPSYSRGREILELNIELKKVTEKYKDTDIFPDIEVVRNTSLNQHPVMQALSGQNGVIFRSIGSPSTYYPIDKERVQWKTPIVTQLRNKPDMTLPEFIKENWEAIRPRHDTLVNNPWPCQLYIQYKS